MIVKKKHLALLTLAVGLGACQSTWNKNIPEGITFVESVQRQSDELVIPYEKYQLANGLTVILHEDDSDPLVHVDVTYHVGSGREATGKSGFAHFFEHMMFQGSEHVADEEHFKIVSEAGGTLNGTTNMDRTNYFETVPANQLEKMLWLESDRMGYFLDAVTQEKFEVQRETVKNERAQNYDNRPYGRAYETMLAAMYPPEDAYSWPTIGYIDDLNRMDVDDLKQFFLRWYGPNNATITIGGAINKQETLALVNKYFGGIPKGPAVAMPDKPTFSLPETRHVSYQDNISLPLLQIAFPTVYARHEDEAPLDVLSQILGGGKTSLLYKNLVKTQVAVQAGSSHGCSERACRFQLIALPNPASGKSLADLEKVIRAAFEEFEQRGVNDDDLIKLKAEMEAGAIFGLQSVRGKVSQLAAYETFMNNPNYIAEDVDRYNRVTKEDVLRVYEQYIKGKNSVVLSVVPMGKPALAAKPDTFELPKRLSAKKTGETLPLRKADTTVDRSKAPVASANPLVTPPELWKTQMDNGLEIMGAQSTETPTTSISIRIPGGHYHTEPLKAGLAGLTAGLMNESTQERSSEDMALALEKLGSSVSVSASSRFTSIYISSLTKNLRETLALAMEKIQLPAFNRDDFQRLQGQTLEGIKMSQKNADSLASQAWVALLFGDSVRGMPESGTLSTMNALSVEDVKGYYQRFIKPNGAEVTVVSDLDKAALLKEMSLLNQWTGQSEARNTAFMPRELDTKKVYIVNKDNAAQSVIRIGKHGLPRDFTGNFFKTTLANFPLGGAFNSRINLNLREDKGYTYGARSYVWGDQFNGGFTATGSIRADVTDKAFDEFAKEISRYQAEGINKEEIEFMRLAVGQKDALKYETPQQKLRFVGNIQQYNLDEQFVKTQASIIENISQGDINALAKKHMVFDDMIKLVVGDYKTLKPQFEAMGYDVELIELPK